MPTPQVIPQPQAQPLPETKPQATEETLKLKNILLDPEKEIKDEDRKEWNPDDKQRARIKFVYTERDDMIHKRDQSYPHFNDRTLLEFIDDSEKRMNAYVLPKEMQGKEEWQSNFATRAYANKAKALLAATARELPDMRYRAVNDDEQFDYMAADITKNLVRHSYFQQNLAEDIFFLSWSCVTRGTVLSYEGFHKQIFRKKKIKAYDLLTGDVEFEEVSVTAQGDPITFEIHPMNLLIKNFFIRDIQKQPALDWWAYYSTRDEFESDWGAFPNAKFVKDGGDIKVDEHDTFFHKHYKETLKGGRGFVVDRYMNVFKDIYRVVCNGVELYNGPMLWVDVGNPDKKVYPIAKTIFEAFADGMFFYGNSMPNSAMGEGDVLNTLTNSSLDKTYRSMVPPLLIGQINKDMMDLEDEVVAGDTKIYVDDINQVKQMEIKGVNEGDVRMLDIIGRGFDLTTLDPSQEGSAQKYVTARAAVAADERARQLKGLFFMFMESLWHQKIKLRTANVLLAYTRPKLVQIIGPDGVEKLEEQYRTFNVENTELSDGTKGTLAVKFFGSRDAAAGQKDMLAGEEEASRMQGQPFEKIGVVYDYLNNFRHMIQIVPESLWQSSQALRMAMSSEKTEYMMKVFPEYFAQNKAILFKDFIKNYDDDPDKYEIGETLGFEDEKALELVNGKMGKNAGSQNSGIVSDITGTDSNNSLAKVSGVEQ